jgi:iron uptake system EfeUOB component EfeO/EfeM
MVNEFRHFVEENAGWWLLWNDNNNSKSEKVAQLLFIGVVKHYRHVNNIDISPEPNIGGARWTSRCQSAAVCVVC